MSASRSSLASALVEMRPGREKMRLTRNSQSRDGQFSRPLRSRRLARTGPEVGLGLALIDSDAKAAGAAPAVSLLIEVAAILVLVKVARLTLSWRRHRRSRKDAMALASAV